MTVEGLKVFPSRHGVAETVQRLEVAIARYGMTIFARIDHAAAAEKVGMDLPPTIVILFGNARAGTPLMQARPTVAIDLPLKILVWQDGAGAWLAYNDPVWIAHRHGLPGDGSVEPFIEAMAAIASEAATT